MAFIIVAFCLVNFPSIDSENIRLFFCLAGGSWIIFRGVIHVFQFRIWFLVKLFSDVWTKVILFYIFSMPIFLFFPTGFNLLSWFEMNSVILFMYLFTLIFIKYVQGETIYSGKNIFTITTLKMGGYIYPFNQFIHVHYLQKCYHILS